MADGETMVQGLTYIRWGLGLPAFGIEAKVRGSEESSA